MDALGQQWDSIYGPRALHSTSKQHTWIESCLNASVQRGHFLRQKWSYVSHRIPFWCCPLEGSERNVKIHGFQQNLQISMWILCIFRKNWCFPLESSLWNENWLSILLVLSQNLSNPHQNLQNPHQNLQNLHQNLQSHEIHKIHLEISIICIKILRILQSWGLGIWLSKVFQTKNQTVHKCCNWLIRDQHSLSFISNYNWCFT